MHSERSKRLRDDRGRLVEVRWISGSWDTALRMRRWKRRSVLASVLAFLLAPVWLTLLEGWVRRGVSVQASRWVVVVLGGVTVLAFAVSAGIALRMSLPGHEGRRVRRWRVGRGRCGACNYSLRKLTAGEDGCIVCPECGSAWKRFHFSHCGACGYDRQGLDDPDEKCPECGKVPEDT